METSEQDDTARSLILRTDGACRGNPGHSAAGIVIQEPDGVVMATGMQYLGIMTNNQAEYRALILGLKAIAHYHPAHVDVYMDSQLVVNQMRGEYRVRHLDLELLWRDAQALVAALPSVSFEYVPRAENALADRLANEALNARKRAQ